MSGDEGTPARDTPDNEEFGEGKPVPSGQLPEEGPAGQGAGTAGRRESDVPSDAAGVPPAERDRGEATGSPSNAG